MILKVLQTFVEKQGVVVIKRCLCGQNNFFPRR